MPVTNVRSKWSSGNLIFYEAVAGNDANVQYGEDGSGLDVMFRGATASAYAWWDEANDSFSFAGIAHLRLNITDTDGTLEGQIWYDASEDKIKFKTAASVETVTST